MTPKGRKRALGVLVAAALFVALLAGAYALRKAQRVARAEEARERGMELFQAADYDEALPKLSSAVAVFRQDGETLIALAECRRRVPAPNRKHLLDATSFARAAMLVLPGDPRPPELLMEIYQQLGFVSETLSAADDLLKARADDVRGLRMRTECLLVLGRIDEAEQSARTLATSHPESADGHRLVMIVMRAQGALPDKLVPYIDGVVKDHPGVVALASLRARAHALAGDRRGARDILLEAVDMPLSTLEELQDLLRLLDVLGMRDESERLMARVGNDPALGLAGQLVAVERAFQSGDLPRASRLIEATMSQSDAPSDDELGWRALLSNPGTRTGTPAYTELATRSGEQAGYWRAVIEAADLLYKGQAREARGVVSPYSGSDSEKDLARYLTAEADRTQGELARAASEFKALADRNPRWLAVRVGSAECLLDMGRADEAYNEAVLALVAWPDRVLAVDTLARASVATIEAGQADDAVAEASIELLRRIGEERPGLGEPEVLLCRALIARDRAPEAREMLLRMATDSAADQGVVGPMMDIAMREGWPEIAERLQRRTPDPNASPDLNFAQAMWLADQGRLDESRRLLRAAIERAENVAERKRRERLLSKLLVRAGAPDAVKYARELSDKYPEDPLVLSDELAIAGAWDAEERVVEIIARLRRATEESALAWRIYEARRLLNFTPNQGRAAEAIRLLLPVRASDPSNDAALRLMAEANLVLGDRPSAVRLLAQAADASPGDASRYPRLITLLRELGDQAEAARRLRDYLRIPLEDRQATLARAELAISLALWEEAIGELSALAEAGSPEAAVRLAEVFLRRARFDDAIRMTQRAEELGAEAESWTPLRADARVPREGADVARTEFDRLPAGETRALLLAAFDRRNSRPDRAEAELRAALAASESVPVRIELARLLLSDGRVAEGRAIIEEGLARAPDSLPLRTMREVGAAIAMEANVAEGALAESRSDGPPMPEIIRLARAVEAGQGSEQDLQKLADFSNQWPASFAVSAIVVRANLAAGQAQSAVDVASRAAQRDLLDPRASQLYCETLTAAGRLPEALIAARQWLDRSLDAPYEPTMAIAGLEFEIGMRPQALPRIIEWRERIEREAQDHPQRLGLLVKLFLTDGRDADARASIERFRAVNSVAAAFLAAEAAGALHRDPTRTRSWLDWVDTWIGSDPRERLAAASARYELFVQARDPADAAALRRTLEPLTGDPQLSGRASLLLAGVADALGETGEAARLYRIALQTLPDDPVALNNLAVALLADQSQPGSSDALQFAERAVAAARDAGWPDANLSSAIETLSQARLAAGDAPGALDAARKAFEIDPSSLAVRLALAEALLATGSRDEADRMAQDVERGLRSRPYREDGLAPRLKRLESLLSGRSVPSGG
ncbi:MAG: tetratricopeptide repeat protein [Phycisphaerales bacterium]|jgi:tetratricopeptide (TPR) repeat protein|nr:tetratricopeptide repeat protein [Phycisphaerales bacterium]